ncbi:MAG: hypothetical protein ACRD5L_02395, partial [Bryobacteraceae bacterium]
MSKRLPRTSTTGCLRTRQNIMSHVIKTLLNGLIDYAGLFPPAQEPMESAAANYAAYLSSGQAFALGRFIVPVTHLGELANAALDIEIEKDWRLSALAGSDFARDLRLIEAFNDEHAGRFAIDTVESKPEDPGRIDSALELVPQEITAYFEIPLVPEPASFLTALRGSKGRAKVRTGGIVEATFPQAREIAVFLKLAAASSDPFKATSGLHHPLRSLQPLTYEPGAQCAWMHGFLNLVFAAALVREGMEEQEAADLLNEAALAQFCFEPDAVAWRDWKLGSAQLAAARAAFIVSIGSCSFTEP